MIEFDTGETWIWDFENMAARLQALVRVTPERERC